MFAEATAKDVEEMHTPQPGKDSVGTKVMVLYQLLTDTTTCRQVAVFASYFRI